MIFRFKNTFAFALLLFIVSCRKDVGKVNHGNYPSDVGAIITGQCATAGCHDSKSYLAANGLNLQTWTDMFSGSGSGSPVIPYNSRFSSLCYFINTYSDLGLQNVPTMPLNKAALTHDQVKMIKDWIDNGAPDLNGNVMWANNTKRKKLYAANQGCDVITVFDSETQLPIRYIPVGHKPVGNNTPHMVRVSPDGEYWYVVFIGDNIMQKFRCSDDSYVGDIPLTPLAAGTGVGNALDWNTFVITKDGKRAYCVSWTANGMVSSVDLEHMRFINYLPGLTYPHAIVLNDAEDKLYVATQLGNYITPVDTSLDNTGFQISLQNGQPPYDGAYTLDPHDMILSPDGNNLIITCQQSNEVRVFNIPSNTVTAVIPVGVYPQEIVYSKSTNQYFVSCTEDTTSFPGFHGTVTRIDAVGWTPTKIQCGFQPHGIAVDENKKLVYVLSRNYTTAGPAPHHGAQCLGRNGFINFIDMTTFKLLPKRYELSVDPYFVYARP